MQKESRVLNVLCVGQDPQRIINGYNAINKRNIECLKSIRSIKLYTLPIDSQNRLFTAFNSFFGLLSGLSIISIFRTILMINSSNINVVFFQTSKLGFLTLVCKLFFPNVKCVIFMHNIEKQYVKEEMIVDKSLKTRYFSWLICLNEYFAVKNSSDVIVLNSRDQELLLNYYNVEASLLLPTSFPSLRLKHVSSQTQDKTTFTMLFVGYNFFANSHGIVWFITNVFPMLPNNCNLVVVGKNMSKITLPYISNRIKVLDYVEDLESIYYSSDAVILPIFYGGGMKTKTAEALMYGKPIIGTSEAFRGYDFVRERVGFVCDDADSFIESINNYVNNPEMLVSHSKNARKIFEEDYSYESSVSALTSFFQNL